MDLRGKAVRGIAAGIGLASESVSAYKANKREKKEREAQRSVSDLNGEQQQQQLSLPENTAHEEASAYELVEQQHEEAWELDEAQDELHEVESPTTQTERRGIDQLTEEFLRDIPPPTYTLSATPKLPYPVVLPQRRPKSKKRGFIRAYAPVLQDFGIDQKVFLDFLETSNRACLATPWLYALNLATIPTMFLPSVLSMVISTVIQIGTEVAIEVEGRRKTNAFFDKINKEFFRPRGLFCLVMTWKPESSSTFAKFDLNSAISTSIEHGGSGLMNKLKHKLKSSSGQMQENLDFPETAPLIFPDLDDALRAAGSEGKMKGMKKRQEFVADYLDRRSQAKFTLENPDSALNMAPKPKFTSRYADPSHPASSGDVLGLITGGCITSDKLQPRRSQGLGMRQERGLQSHPVVNIIQGIRSRGSVAQHPQNTGNEFADEAFDTQSAREMRGGGRRRQQRGQQLGGGVGGSIKGGVKNILKSNVLYLMIVNMPSEEELAEARAMLNS